MNTDRVISASLPKLDSKTLTKPSRKITAPKKLIGHRIAEPDIKAACRGDTQKTIELNDGLNLRSWKMENLSEEGHHPSGHTAEAHLNVNQDLKERGRLTAMMIDDLTQHLYLTWRER